MSSAGSNVSLGVMPGSSLVATPFALGVRAHRVVAKALHRVARFGPHGHQIGPVALRERRAAELQANAHAIRDARNVVHERLDSVRGEHRAHLVAIRTPDLHDRAELFVEKILQRVLGPAVERDVETAMSGQRHLDQRNERTAVGAIVIREQKSFGIRLLDRREERTKSGRIVEIRREPAVAIESLQKHRTAQSRLTGAKINEPELAVASINLKLRSQRASRIACAGERRHDQRDRCNGTLLDRIGRRPHRTLFSRSHENVIRGAG